MTGNEPRNAPGNDPGTDSGNSTSEQIEISSDEDWKSRVKAEDAALEQQFRTQQPKATEAAAGGSATGRPDQSAQQKERTRREKSATAPPRLPEASLASLLGMLSTQAMVALGLLPNPVTGKAEQELSLARYFIDLITVLEQKTAGNLDRDEAAALDETLHTLRMAFIQRSKETA